MPGPVLPQTPGNKKKVIKDFFSPLPLETMFEPPSPPPPLVRPTSSQSHLHANAPKVPSRLAISHTPASEGNSFATAEDTSHLQPYLPAERKPSLDGRFTFAISRHTPVSSHTPGAPPQAQSTPGPISVHRSTIHPPSMPDPRLRLFQFQYDTFTRDHLSAIVDSIAVNSPSSGSGSAGESPAAREGAVTSRPRVAKRIRLSSERELDRDDEGIGAAISRPRVPEVKVVDEVVPAQSHATQTNATSRPKAADGVGTDARVSRPRVLGKDYVGESQSLMDKIKQARDFSTISTNASGQTPAKESLTASPAGMCVIHVSHILGLSGMMQMATSVSHPPLLPPILAARGQVRGHR